MARPRFKKWLADFVPTSAERALFSATSALATQALIWLWQPMTQEVWRAPDALQYPIWALFWVGAAIVPITEGLMDQFELNGLTQAMGRYKAVQEMSLSPLHNIVSSPNPYASLATFSANLCCANEGIKRYPFVPMWKHAVIPVISCV